MSPNPVMIVCVCHAISDKEIVKQANMGCGSFDALQDRTRVATCCGCCETCAREVFDEARQAGSKLIPIARMSVATV
ncbi:(2Fe-2S)-binding protein [Aquabacterium parvum]|uniref:(2Fe-2S)-binding protein n=1 Tax=Aquabacterium parvum TaxID=70584 RepID=UPI001F173937|nr:(2Fe-2S)-binding protein [Aquabacterium parvum]